MVGVRCFLFLCVFSLTQKYHIHRNKWKGSKNRNTKPQHCGGGGRAAPPSATFSRRGAPGENFWSATPLRGGPSSEFIVALLGGWAGWVERWVGGLGGGRGWPAPILFEIYRNATVTRGPPSSRKLWKFTKFGWILEFEFAKLKFKIHYPLDSGFWILKSTN